MKKNNEEVILNSLIESIINKDNEISSLKKSEAEIQKKIKVIEKIKDREIDSLKKSRDAKVALLNCDIKDEKTLNKRLSSNVEKLAKIIKELDIGYDKRFENDVKCWQKKIDVQENEIKRLSGRLMQLEGENKNA